MILSRREQQVVAAVEEALRPKLPVEAIKRAINERIQTDTKHLLGSKVTDDFVPAVTHVVKDVLRNIEGYDGDLDKVKVELDPNDRSTLNIDFPQPTVGSIKVDF